MSSDPVGVALRHEIGIDNICWEMDYPHSDLMLPGTPAAGSCYNHHHQYFS